jgi:hypothetical protein
MFLKSSKVLILANIILILASCSDSKKSSDTPTGTNNSTATSFAEIAPIIKNSCGLTGCHGVSGAKSLIFENNEANIKSSKASIKDRLSRSKTDKLYMPQSPGVLSDADKAKILNYLN